MNYSYIGGLRVFLLFTFFLIDTVSLLLILSIPILTFSFPLFLTMPTFSFPLFLAMPAFSFPLPFFLTILSLSFSFSFALPLPLPILLSISYFTFSLPLFITVSTFSFSLPLRIPMPAFSFIVITIFTSMSTIVMWRTSTSCSRVWTLRTSTWITWIRPIPIRSAINCILTYLLRRGCCRSGLIGLFRSLSRLYLCLSFSNFRSWFWLN